MSGVEWIIWIVVAFLVGSMPFGVLIARAHGIDLRQVSSGNTGATNVGRALGRGWAVTCFGLDAAKGVGPVLAAGFLGSTIGVSPAKLIPIEAWAWILVGLATILGHIYSPFLRFRGGKGVSTTCGALGAMWPLMTIPFAVAICVFFVVRFASGYMSLASIVATWSLPVTAVILALFNSDSSVATVLPPLVAGCVIASLVTWRHRSNIARLRAGTEPKANAASSSEVHPDS